MIKMVDAGVGHCEPEPHCDAGRRVGYCCRLEGEDDDAGHDYDYDDNGSNTGVDCPKTSSQAPSYASPKLRPTDLLTGVKCRATNVAKN